MEFAQFASNLHGIRFMLTRHNKVSCNRSILILLLYAPFGLGCVASTTLEDKIEGMLIGSAIGDAAGGPVEFVHPPVQGDWVKSKHKLNTAALEEIGSKFRLSPYPKKAEPFAQWEDYGPAGTITDDTRFKIIFFNALREYGMNLSQQQFAQSVMEFRQFLRKEYRDNYDQWIPEIAYATNWALGNRENAFPVERIWGGIPTMEGQMPFLPIAAIHPEDPESP